MYQIWCTVSGGMMGSPEDWLKENGELYQTFSRKEAETLCKKYNKEMNSSEYSTARYYYKVVSMFPED